MDTPEELTITVEANGAVTAALIKDGEYYEETFDDVDLDELEELIDTLEQETEVQATVIYEMRPDHQLAKLKKLQQKNIATLKHTILVLLLTLGILFIAYHDQL